MPSVPDPSLLEPFEAQYRLVRNGFTIGNVDRRLDTDGSGEYRFVSEIYAAGLARLFFRDRYIETSLFTWREGGELLPQRYSFQRQGRKRVNRNATFDWQGKVLQLNDNDRRKKMELDAGVLDRLSSELAIIRDLRLGRTRSFYRITDGKRVRDYVVKLEEPEWLDTPLGRLDTQPLSLASIMDDDEKSGKTRQITVWCARDLGYLPVRLKVKEKRGSRTRHYEIDIKSFQNGSA